MRSIKTEGLAILLLASAALPASAANLVLNPGFESGSTNWTVGHNSWTIGTTAGIAGAHTGTFDASTGCVGSTCIAPDPDGVGAWFYQDLATTPGQNYSLTLWFASNGAPMEFKVLFGSTTALDLVDVGCCSYAQYSNTATLTASSSTTRLEFLGRQDPGFNSLDDIDVEAIGQGGVPEPSAFLLLGGGLALLGGLRYRLKLV